MVYEFVRRVGVVEYVWLVCECKVKVVRWSCADWFFLMMIIAL